MHTGLKRGSPMSSRWYTGPEPALANTDALSRRPCTLGGCQYCERREARERELRIEEETCPMHERAGPVCRGTQMVDAAEWQTQQEQNMDRQPV